MKATIFVFLFILPIYLWGQKENQTSQKFEKKNTASKVDGTGLEYASSSKRWNGKYNGKDLPMGTCLYIFDLHDNKDPITGTVTIIH